MSKFSNWLNEDEGKPKGWTANQDTIIKSWQALPPNMPYAQVRAVPHGHRGSTLNYDGIRITGSGQFINTILSRLKDMLQFTDSSALELAYEQQIDNKTEIPIPDSYVFYLKFKEKGPTI